MTTDEAASLGLPSYVWRAGQDRRLAMVLEHAAPLGDALDVGCGIGLYVERMARSGARAFGVEVDADRARLARARGLDVAVAVAESLPFADGSFDTVLLHEVLEHVRDDRAAVGESVRTLRTGGHVVVFVPNRGWPFETHGAYWRGRYRFGNVPLVNYLPDPLRNRLAPHVRVYTGAGASNLFRGLPATITVRRHVFPGYDKLMASRPWIGRVLRAVTYRLENGPLSVLGLSHLVVARRDP